MSNQNDRDTKLIAAAFHDDWAEGPMARFARAAAAHARRRRAARRALVTASLVAVGAMAFIVTRPPTPVSPTISPAPSITPAYEIISDDDLLAELRDRPLLVVKKKNGEKEFVLLGAVGAPANGG